MSAEQREDLAMFIALQHLRVPGHREHVARRVMELLDQARASAPISALEDAAGRSLSEAEIEWLRRPNPAAAEPTGVVGGALIIFGPQLTEDLLTRFTWTVHTMDTAGLVTCDTPVHARTGNEAEGLPESLLELPLDPSNSLVLQAGHPVDLDLLPRALLLRLYQHTKIDDAERWVYGHPDNPLWDMLNVSRVSRTNTEVS